MSNLPVSQRALAWYDRKKVERNLLGQVLRKIRRFYLGTFYPDYIRKSAEIMRTGDCNQCGACCELIYKCPFLGRDSQNLAYCRIYGDLRPANCRNYPFDAADAEIDDCSYGFKPGAPLSSKGYRQDPSRFLFYKK